MANFICKIRGSRGRTMTLYDTKCVIKTKVSVGSVLTHNATDGEKTIFLIDVSGVQFKRSGFAIGFLQFETSSMQMNNKNSSFFSENTFTFEDGRNNVTNELMETIYNYVTDRIEELKYGEKIINQIPSFNIDQDDDDDDEYYDEEIKEETKEEKFEIVEAKEYSDIADFLKEVQETSTEDLALILEDQRDLYSKEEIKVIEKELKHRND